MNYCLPAYSLTVSLLPALFGLSLFLSTIYACTSNTAPPPPKDAAAIDRRFPDIILEPGSPPYDTLMRIAKEYGAYEADWNRYWRRRHVPILYIAERPPHRGHRLFLDLSEPDTSVLVLDLSKPFTLYLLSQLSTGSDWCGEIRPMQQGSPNLAASDIMRGVLLAKRNAWGAYDTVELTIYHRTGSFKCAGQPIVDYEQ